jgi:hypothetical protein
LSDSWRIIICLFQLRENNAEEIDRGESITANDSKNLDLVLTCNVILEYEFMLNQFCNSEQAENVERKKFSDTHETQKQDKMEMV